MKVCRTEQQARDQLKKYSVEFYWDLALSQAIVEAEDDLEWLATGHDLTAATNCDSCLTYMQT